MRIYLAGWLLLIAMNSPVAAQLAPEIGYMHPGGAQAGTTVEVTLGGYDWTPDMQLFVHDPRIKLELLGPPTPVLITEPPYWFGAKARGYAWPLPREFRARLTVPADVSPGLVKWQAANANGVSPTGTLHISGLPETAEISPHVEPQRLPSLPVIVSGQIRRIEEVDRYQIRPQRSGPITIELLARQLTTPANPLCLHGMLQVTDDTGRRVVDVAGTEGLDLQATFAAEADRDYTISLHDVDFAGDRSYVYRLAITPGPGLVAAYPAAGRRGETRTVEFVGYGIATGAGVLESVSKSVSFPATANDDVFATALETPFGTTPPFSFVLSDGPELVEGAALTELPAAITGTLEKRFGTETYSVTLKKGDVWHISAYSCTLGAPLDLDLSLINSAGKEFATADDAPGTTDAELTFPVPDDGVYTVRVIDRSGHSGHRGACYRLSFSKPKEDVAFNIPDLLAVPLGTTGKLPIKMTRLGGFKGDVTLAVQGLPAGFTFPDQLVIPADKNELNIDVVCAPDAAASAGLVTVQATMTLNDVPVTRTVKSLVIASTMKPRIKITPEGLDDVRKVRRGSTFLFPLLIERLDGFAGAITLEMTAKQQRHRQGLASDEMVVDPVAARVDYPIFVPEWMETTKTSRMILNGRISLPDPQGNVRTLLQKMELRLGILPEGAMMKLAHVPGEYTVTPGGAVTIPLTVSRIAEFREPVTVALVPMDAQAGQVAAETITMTAGDTAATLQIRLPAATMLTGEQSFLIRATAQQPGRGLVMSETTVVVDVVKP